MRKYGAKRRRLRRARVAKRVAKEDLCGSMEQRDEDRLEIVVSLLFVSNIAPSRIVAISAHTHGTIGHGHLPSRKPALSALTS